MMARSMSRLHTSTLILKTCVLGVADTDDLHVTLVN